MQVIFHPESEEEFREATLFYEATRTGLGLRFEEEIASGIELIRTQPFAWTQTERGIRRYLLKRFPYGILYEFDETNQTVVIVAVAHLHRDPDYWQHRVGRVAPS